MFTSTGLFAAAVTWLISQQELRTTREGQITDRYTKAVEQLGSSKREVRTAAAFVREHDPAATIPGDKLPEEPDTDAHAALSVLAHRPAHQALAGARRMGSR